MDRFVKGAQVTDIKPGKAKFIHLGDIGIAIFNADGAFYAIEDRCAKDSGSLSKGSLMGTMVECPNDGAQFYLPTGECIDPLTLRWVTSFRVRIDGEEIKIELKEAKKPARVYPFLKEPVRARVLRGENQHLS
jgi:3-phenylpropionate/trans-cinnamate dioxygenase ferredoxin component